VPKTRHPVDATDKTHTFLARDGATVLRGGIAAIPTAIFTYQALLDLSPQETWFISYILAHKWDEDLPYPSLRKMGERTGLSVRQLHRIKDSIIEKGYLQLVPRHRAEDGGQDSNAYDFGGLFGRIEELLRADGRLVEERQAAPYPEAGGEPPPLRSVAAQAPPRQAPVATRRAATTTVPPASPGGMTGMSPGRTSRMSPGGVTEMSPGGVTEATLGAATPPTPARGTQRPPAAGTRTARPPVSGESYEKSPAQEAPQEPGDSNRFSPYVMAVASDLSRELGDQAHEVANMSQANRLWQESGLDEAAFVGLMQEARRRTRRAQGAQGAGSVANRAAYYFQVLRGLVTSSEQRAASDA
jgi:hypothetical protein